jgi:hypothetical protein
MRVIISFIMRARESTSIVVIFAVNACSQTRPRTNQVAGKGRWIGVVMPHWKGGTPDMALSYSTLHTPHSTLTLGLDTLKIF